MSNARFEPSLNVLPANGAVCPLCGSPIVSTISYELQSNAEPIYSVGNRFAGYRGHRDTVSIQWICRGGCQISVQGLDPGRPLFEEQIEPISDVRTDTGEPLTGESLKGLAPKVLEAREAMKLLEGGQDGIESNYAADCDTSER